MHHPIQVFEPDWNTCFCELPEAARQTRRRILAEAADRDLLLVPTHFGPGRAVRVRRGAGGFRPVFEIPPRATPASKDPHDAVSTP